MEERSQQMIQEVGQVIMGKQDVVEKIWRTILVGGHVLLNDVPGVGKTTLALAFSRALGLEYRRVQFTPDVVPSDITGFTVLDRETGKFTYQPGAVMCNLLLADEINRTSSKTQSALLEAMEERQVTVDGVSHPLPAPFLVIATQNPIGSAGTQPLPAAQLDRFMICTEMGYPDVESQIEILRSRQTEDPLSAVQVVMTAEELQAIKDEVAQIHVAEPVLRYMAELAKASREHELVRLGISPRGVLALNRVAKAQAYMQGRDYVIPEDVETVFVDVCAHRLVLHAKARISETGEADVLRQLLAAASHPDKF